MRINGHNIKRGIVAGKDVIKIFKGSQYITYATTTDGAIRRCYAKNAYDKISGKYNMNELRKVIAQRIKKHVVCIMDKGSLVNWYISILSYTEFKTLIK